MLKTPLIRIARFDYLDFGHSDLFRVSDFEIPNLPTF